LSSLQILSRLKREEYPKKCTTFLRIVNFTLPLSWVRLCSESDHFALISHNIGILFWVFVGAETWGNHIQVVRSVIDQSIDSASLSLPLFVQHRDDRFSYGIRFIPIWNLSGSIQGNPKRALE
jgi:hypothetical protein